MKNLFIKSLSVFMLIVVLSGCGASSRRPMKNQTIYVRDSQTKKPLSNVVLYANGLEVGVTAENGKMKYALPQENYEKTLTLKATKEGYRDINISIANKVGGGYVFGNLVWFLFGGIPGIIAFSVDGVSGKWYVYQGRVNINMNSLSTPIEEVAKN